MFARARATETWLAAEFSTQLVTWLATAPASGQTLSLQGLAYPLAVKLVACEPGQPPLLKLLDGQQPSGDARLMSALLLTRRESQVLYWLANGKTNREIAEILTMSPRTVNKHLEQVFPKLGVENRTAAAARAIRVLEQEGA